MAKQPPVAHKKSALKNGASYPAKKSGKRRKAELELELEVIELDLEAKAKGPTKKSWSHLDMKTFRPANANQTEAVESWANSDNIGLFGSAGTGKTLLATYLASSVVFRRDEAQDHIIIVRSAVETRKLGFLPGTLDEKIAAYEDPYKDAMTWLFGRSSTYEDMKAAGKVTFLSTSFLRGVTWDRAIVIVDEAQNMTWHELNTIMTRIGQDTRIILTGDTKQCDFDGTREQSGLPMVRDILKDIRGFSTVEFTRADIVRSGFVRSWVTASEQYQERLNMGGSSEQARTSAGHARRGNGRDSQGGTQVPTVRYS